MNAREAKQFAWWICSSLVQATVDLGWSFDEDWPELVLWDQDGLTRDGERVKKALEEVLAEMRRRS